MHQLDIRLAEQHIALEVDDGRIAGVGVMIAIFANAVDTHHITQILNGAGLQ